MNTPRHCQRCGYQPPHCTCSNGPLTPVRAAIDLDAYPDPMQPGHVAAVFGSAPKTVVRWANTGKIPSFATPGGHRRFRKADVRALLNGQDGGQS